MRPLGLLFILFLVFFAACQVEKKAELSNTPKDFDAAHSDPAAIELADSIIMVAGGSDSWDKTRFITWSSEGRITYWDKQMGRARIETNDESIYLINLNSNAGKVRIKGREITAPDSLHKLIKAGKASLIDDVYGLVLPFKLKDSGVTLKYMGEDTLKSTKYNILQLNIPEGENGIKSKYVIYVDVKEKVVKYWSYYADINQQKPTFTRPWDHYTRYGSILLSGDRSYDEGLTGVRIEQNLPEKLFTEF